MTAEQRGLHLGFRRGDGEKKALELPLSALLRHAMALGSSGSGKTVFCKAVVEEVVRAGVPAICVDPQGDLCSLLTASDPAKLEEHGVDPAAARQFHERADVVIFTPASRTGVPLCADPIDPAAAELPKAQRVRALSRTATTLVSLLGYDIDGDEGAGLTAVFDHALNDAVKAGSGLAGLGAFADYLGALKPKQLERYGRYLDVKRIRTALQRLARLDVGARRMLFHEGIPIDPDVLLGRRGPSEDGRVRVSVIYLNTLHTQEDKDFFVAALAGRLYDWMLQHPSTEPQALFYIDEVAPFVPPVRKPACKESLQLLFKQARKYGVCCLMATQNPGDVDYKAMAQFGSWALGRLTTRQDIKKIEPTVKALDPLNSDAIVGELPSLKPGEFVLLSPDWFDETASLGVRWLYGTHETWDEDRIETEADTRWRERFAELERGREPDPASVESTAAEDAESERTAEERDEEEDEEREGEGEDLAGASEAAPGELVAKSAAEPEVVLSGAPPDSMDEPAPQTLRMEDYEAQHPPQQSEELEGVPPTLPMRPHTSQHTLLSATQAMPVEPAAVEVTPGPPYQPTVPMQVAPQVTPPAPVPPPAPSPSPPPSPPSPRHPLPQRPNSLASSFPRPLPLRSPRQLPLDPCRSPNPNPNPNPSPAWTRS